MQWSTTAVAPVRTVIAYAKHLYGDGEPFHYRAIRELL
jgi:hypothetical protein